MPSIGHRVALSPKVSGSLVKSYMPKMANLYAVSSVAALGPSTLLNSSQSAFNPKRMQGAFNDNEEASGSFFQKMRDFMKSDDFTYMKDVVKEVATKGSLFKASYDYGYTKAVDNSMEEGFDLRHSDLTPEAEFMGAIVSYHLAGPVAGEAMKGIEAAVGIGQNIISKVASTAVAVSQGIVSKKTPEEIVAGIIKDEYQDSRVGKILNRTGILPSDTVEKAVIDTLGAEVKVELNRFQQIESRVYGQTNDLYDKGTTIIQRNSAQPLSDAKEVVDRMKIQIDKYDQIITGVKKLKAENPDHSQVSEYLERITANKNLLLEKRNELSGSVIKSLVRPPSFQRPAPESMVQAPLTLSRAPDSGVAAAAEKTNASQITSSLPQMRAPTDSSKQPMTRLSSKIDSALSKVERKENVTEDGPAVSQSQRLI